MIYEHGLLITVDAERRIIGDGAMVVRDGRFAAIDKTATLRERFPLEQRIDLKGKVVTPGLVNTHVHLAQAMIRGCADDMELLEWLGKRVWVLQGNYTEEDGRASAELCILEMLKSGTTAFVESLLAERYGFSGIAEVVLRSGIRAALAKIVMDVGTYATKTGWMHPGMVEDRDTSLKNTLAMYDQWNGAGNGRLAVWFGPRTPGGVTPELYRQITALAHERNMGVTVHLAEVASDRKFLQETYGLSPARYAESVGLVGPRVLLVHAVWMAAAVQTWVEVRHEIDELLDSHRAQAAALLVVQQAGEIDEHGPGIDAPTLHRYAPKVAFQVFHEGQLVLRSANAPAQPMAGTEREGQPQFRTVQIEGNDLSLIHI